MGKKYHLNPLESEPTSYKIVAFDVEGTGEPGGFIIGVVWDWEGPHLYKKVEDMRLALLSRKYRGCRIFAHNLEYDWGVLFQDVTEGWSVIRLRSHLIKCTYTDSNKHIWRFWDTSNLCAFQSVYALGRILGMEKHTTPEWLKSDGRSSISATDLSESQWATLIEYCMRDTEIVYRYANHIQDVVNGLGGEIHTTLAGTAMDIFRRVYLKESFRTPHPWLNEKARSAYYGGRTEVFQYGTGHGMYEYDVHSMYPAVMRHVRLPNPSFMYYIDRRCKARYIEQYEGVTNCTVIAPTLHIPILPTRVEGRLLFLVGEFTGSWCHNELRFALANGYEIKDIHWQLIATESCNPLKEYVETLYQMKVEAERNSNPSYFVYKLLLNSLYGKFGQKADGQLTRLQRVDQVEGFMEKVGLDLVEWQGHWYVNSSLGAGKQPDYVIVCWAAYITAEARLREYELLKMYDQDVTYCDTDCVVGPWELPESPELGGLGKEFGPVEFEVRAEKYYRWREGEGEWHYRKAGIRREFQKEFWETGRTAYSRPRKIGEAMASNERSSTWITQVKTDLPRLLKRCPIGESWDTQVLMATRPWTYDEAVKVFENAPRLLPWRDGRVSHILELEEQEAEYLAKWELQTQIDTLREACVIPFNVIQRLWDFRQSMPRRVRDSQGNLTTWEYAQADEMATELGYPSGVALMIAVQHQAEIYERIRRLENEKRNLSMVSSYHGVSGSPLVLPRG